MEDNTQYQHSSTNASRRNFSIKQAQEEFKYYFFYVLFKKKWLIIWTSLISMAGLIFALYMITPEFKASSKILVRSNVTQEVVLFKDLYSQSTSMKNTIPANNFIEVATSHAVARDIVAQFKLDEKLRKKREEPEEFREIVWAVIKDTKNELKYWVKYPYNLYLKFVEGQFPAQEGKNYTSKAIKMFMEDMTEIVLVPESDIIILAIWGESPKESEDIANALTQMVIERSVAMEQNAASYGYKFTKIELEKARQELNQATQNVREFKKTWNISKIEMQKEIKLGELDTVEKELVSIQARLSGLRAKYAEGKRQIGLQKKNMLSIQDYRDLQTENIKVKIDIKELEAKAVKYQEAQTRVKEEIASLVDKETELYRLKREAKLKEDLFDLLGKRHDEFNVQSVSNLGGFDLRIIDTPKLEQGVEADYPDWELSLGIGLPSCILVAVILAFLLELQNESFWIGSQVETRLGIPLLGTIRDYSGKKS